MLSPAELAEYLKTVPVGFKPANDEFFSSINKALLPLYKKLGVITNVEEHHETGNSSNAAEFFCNVPGCQLVFDGVSAYQTHFNSVHRYLCAECRRSLPTAHLLDLHISERHDAYFAARVERGDAMYACFLEECKQLMLTPEQRKEHCIGVHKFPGNYRFDQLSGKAASGAKQKSKAESQAPDDTEAMDTGVSTAAVRKTKVFSFGHPKEKTFHAKSLHKNGGKTGEALNESLHDMGQLKEALQELA